MFLCNFLKLNYVRPQSVSLGEIIALVLFLILAVLHSYYWLFVHVYEDKTTIKGIEHTARGFGVIALLFVMFLFFTVTRISLWVECFGLSFEHLIALHRIFGGLALFCGYLHAVLFFTWFRNGVCSLISVLLKMMTTLFFLFFSVFLLFLTFHFF